VNSYVALRPKGYAAVEQQPVRTRNGKAAYHPGRLYDRSAVGDVDGLSGPIDGARCQACSDTADACHLLFGGNKRDARDCEPDRGAKLQQSTGAALNVLKFARFAFSFDSSLSHERARRHRECGFFEQQKPGLLAGKRAVLKWGRPPV
jgi:hypothetical protein